MRANKLGNIIGNHVAVGKNKNIGVVEATAKPENVKVAKKIAKFGKKKVKQNADSKADE